MRVTLSTVPGVSGHSSGPVDGLGPRRRLGREDRTEEPEGTGLSVLLSSARSHSLLHVRTVWPPQACKKGLSQLLNRSLGPSLSGWERALRRSFLMPKGLGRGTRAQQKTWNWGFFQQALKEAGGTLCCRAVGECVGSL